MNETLKKLLAALGLAETTAEADALAAVATLKANADQVAELTAQVATLKAAAPDPAKFVPVDAVAALQAQVASLVTPPEREVPGSEIHGI